MIKIKLVKEKIDLYNNKLMSDTANVILKTSSKELLYELYLDVLLAASTANSTRARLTQSFYEERLPNFILTELANVDECVMRTKLYRI